MAGLHLGEQEHQRELTAEGQVSATGISDQAAGGGERPWDSGCGFGDETYDVLTGWMWVVRGKETTAADYGLLGWVAQDGWWFCPIWGLLWWKGDSQ